MNWQKEAIEDLKNYPYLKHSLISIKQKINALNDKFSALKSRSTDFVSKGTKRDYNEDMLLDNITKRERLQLVYNANRLLCERIENGLNGLNDDERLVINDLFIEKSDNAVLKLCRKLSFEKTKIYSLRAEALKKFTVLMYGIQEY